MNNVVRIAMIGLDSSHCLAFTKLLHTNNDEVSGGRVTFGIPAVSRNLPISICRAKGIMDQLKEDYNVQITEDWNQAIQNTDAIMITSVNGGKHLDFFNQVALSKKPVFIDKPLSCRSSDARKIRNISNKYKTPVLSCSALRYAETILERVRDIRSGQHVTIHGPLTFEDHVPGYYWYGIHLIEIAFMIYGPGIRLIDVSQNEKADTITFKADDHTTFKVIGHKNGDLHDFYVEWLNDADQMCSAYASEGKHFYKSLLWHVLHFFNTGTVSVPLEETIEIISLLEEINKLGKYHVDS